MSVPPSASCPHHIPSHGFSCWVQGPDKGHSLPVASGATRKCLQRAWLCGGACPPLSSLWDVEPSSLHPSLVVRGSQDVAGMCSPCWALLINIRNSTRGYEASNQSVISCMGFAKCLSPDNKQGTSGPASVKELLYDSRAPRGMLGAALGHSVPGPRLCWDVWSGQVLAPCPRLPTAQTSLSSSLQLI